MHRFIVVPRKTRSYGYSLQDTRAQAKPNQYLRSDNCFGWYKYKSDAVARANELNK